MSEIAKAVSDGIKLKMEQDLRDESKKLGILRGGTVGLYSGGDFAGECPRTNILRMYGYYIPIIPSKKYMFEAGEANEDLWEANLRRGRPDWTILTQDECAVKVKLPNSGMLVTGRPDIVIKDMAGIELKLVCSLWVARDILNGDAKLTNLCQSSFYSLSTGLPFELWYTNRSNFAVTGDWVKRLLPKKGANLSQYCEYNPGTGDIKSVQPFKIGFISEWRNDILWVKQVSIEGEVLIDFRETIITKTALWDYYEQVASHYLTDKLPRKPLSVDVFGEKQNYVQCQYCALQVYCTKFQGKTITEFLNGIPEDSGYLKLIPNS